MTCCRAFLEAVRDDTAVPVSAEEGRYAVELCLGGLAVSPTGAAGDAPD